MISVVNFLHFDFQAPAAHPMRGFLSVQKLSVFHDSFPGVGVGWVWLRSPSGNSLSLFEFYLLPYLILMR